MEIQLTPDDKQKLYSLVEGNKILEILNFIHSKLGSQREIYIKSLHKNQELSEEDEFKNKLIELEYNDNRGLMKLIEETKYNGNDEEIWEYQAYCPRKAKLALELRPNIIYWDLYTSIICMILENNDFDAFCSVLTILSRDNATFNDITFYLPSNISTLEREYNEQPIKIPFYQYVFIHCTKISMLETVLEQCFFQKICNQHDVCTFINKNHRLINEYLKGSGDDYMYEIIETVYKMT